ncbi:putative two-component system sensor protein [Indibacter alkaliphilus LW1]|uniref:Two-component system sensor protein n=1 Tax=Indibacter alkaliphilus (strain CCUG 57479 / KCTC 22604 / LW1) TaxID=1189612 RepID=S2D8H2_INDAL|nr:histidine kinase [Indibacter alkaliphilus]EOZ95219.1 putative two-component system sensor protein [Indibacter alkaliphilus LW1]
MKSACWQIFLVNTQNFVLVYRNNSYYNIMQGISIKKNISILTHLLGWAIFGSLLFLLIPLSTRLDFPSEFWTKQIMMFAILVAAFYFNYFYLIPKTLFKNKVGLFLILNLIGGIAYIGLIILFDNLVNMQQLMHEVFRPDTAYIKRPRNLTFDFYNVLIFYMAVGVSTSVATVQKWQQDEEVRFELEKAKTNSELSYLKAQINPHFFFNTLNNIYALTNLDVEQAKTALLKLSRMMRYVLYETEKNLTLLNKELEFIKDFVELMKMRLSSKVKLDIQLPENLDDSNIAPMLFLPFIENCFKHGISSQNESHIAIYLQKEGNEVTLITRNNIFKATENTPEGQSSGIGLANTKRRLELLYPERHFLKIEDKTDSNEFIVKLKLRLK